MKNIKRWALIFLSTAGLVVLDQVTKMLVADALKFHQSVVLIKGVLEFSYLENDGMAWGLLGGARFLFILLTAAALVVLLYVLLRLPAGEKKYRPLLADLCILTAGAVGNLLDRIFLGYVRDFIAFTWIDFPVFNVADICATVSMAYLIILVLFVYKEEEDFAFLKWRRKSQSS